MRTFSVLTVLAAIAASMAVAIPAANAHHLECVDAGSDAVVTAPPGTAGGRINREIWNVLNWTPDCVILDNGGRVTWTQTDALPHQPKAAGCFDLGSMLAGETNSVVFIFDAEIGSVLAAPLLTTATPPALATEITECTTENVVTTETSATITYICEIHGPGMTGTITVGL